MSTPKEIQPKLRAGENRRYAVPLGDPLGGANSRQKGKVQLKELGLFIGQQTEQYFTLG